MVMFLYVHMCMDVNTAMSYVIKLHYAVWVLCHYDYLSCYYAIMCLCYHDVMTECGLALITSGDAHRGEEVGLKLVK